MPAPSLNGDGLFGWQPIMGRMYERISERFNV
jgi:hypothetical protein